ncbi:FkbM family methyltransferase [Roseimicrobium sp. ORNL1]|uniref:FkbM family methyltransferase n=1 Tax=Roseimicrobium sp. ORNL1 TaxID=2711231 RepID=UPI0013E1B9F9|nr:FkbM family methyltransferase [Roseimicrobium sp. ORNL1]QIF04487.1 FkbM family methyltransferase [Roseimicrobium sp. ORNL1]
MSKLRHQIARLVYGSSRLQQIRLMSQVKSAPDLLRSVQWFLKGLIQSETEVATPHGHFRVSTLDTAVARDLYISGKFEEDILTRAFSILEQHGLLKERKVDVLLDVGANIGVTCISLMEMGLVRRAVAIEPDNLNHRLLVTNIKKNGKTECIADIQAAVSDFEGTAELEISATNYGDHRIRMEQAHSHRDVYAENSRNISKVPVKMLDGILAGLPPDYRSASTLLWMDVQGHECRVMDGAANLLRQGIPTVMELWPYGMQRAGVTLQDLHQRLVQNWKSVANLNVDKRPTPIHEWQAIAHNLTRPGDYTNLLLLP